MANLVGHCVNRMALRVKSEGASKTPLVATDADSFAEDGNENCPHDEEKSSLPLSAVQSITPMVILASIFAEVWLNRAVIPSFNAFKSPALARLQAGEGQETRLLPRAVETDAADAAWLQAKKANMIIAMT